MIAPAAIASCTMATSKPPPASASSGSVCASHVHHPTGAAVATSPHSPRRTAVSNGDAPKFTSASAMAAMISGMIVSVR